jgi:4-amino-4-deoxy-L-arabinose transferase-like glycosyltransferase
MPSHLSLRSANSPTVCALVRKAVCVGFLAAGFFALGLGDESFVDEYAYITQSYQPDLLRLPQADERSWFETISYDLVPLPKYLINFSLRLAQIPRPGRGAALSWYDDTSYKWGAPYVLTVARLPSILLAALGCLAIFTIGVLVKDERVGLIAAFLLAVNPLYRLHAHRAMSEAPCEAFLLLALALGLWGWRTTLAGPAALQGLVILFVAGGLAGLSVLSKFTGILAFICFAGWCFLGIALPGVQPARKLALFMGTLAALVAASFVFIELNPFMTARPVGPLPAAVERLAEMGPFQRFLFLVDHRREVSRFQQRAYPHNALHNTAERAKVVAVQGFGRFGPFGPRKSDSTIRYDLPQDWGAICWLPLVVVGVTSAIQLGLRQYRESSLPMVWPLVIWACSSVAVVTAYLPMAWDRYQLPIQAPATLLAAIALAIVWDSLLLQRSRGEMGP